MARQKVIVKRLAAIENFGSMNVLCSDKTGTLTEGVVQIHSAVDWQGKQSDRVLFYAYLNATAANGFANPIDLAIRTDRTFEISAYEKLDEVPYDFIRKRLSILLRHNNAHLMITKGALKSILSICSSVDVDGMDSTGAWEQIQQRFDALGEKGFRTLGVAYRNIAAATIGKIELSRCSIENYYRR